MNPKVVSYIPFCIVVIVMSWLCAHASLENKTYSGIDISKNNSMIALGKNKDVLLVREGQRKMRISANVNVEGTLMIQSKTIEFLVNGVVKPLKQQVEKN